MKASELRIGNYVLNGYGKPFKIEEIISNGNTGGYLLDTLKPIPLTEEWLLRFGFSYRGIYFHFPSNDKFKLQQYKLNNAYWLRHSSDSLDCVRINYVHQLQNLCFALTGEELTLKTEQ